MKLLVLGFLIMTILGCVSAKLGKPNYFEKAKERHKTIAILPAAVKLLVPADAKTDVSRDAIVDAQTKFAFIIQNEMYKWFQKNKYTVAVQDVRYSNEKLFSKGLSFKDYNNIPKDSIAKILGVDAVAYCTTDLTKVSYKNIDVYLDLSTPLMASISSATTAMSIIKPVVTIADEVDVYFRVIDAVTNIKLLEKSYAAKITTNGGLEEFYRNSIKNFAKTFPYKK